MTSPTQPDKALRIAAKYVNRQEWAGSTNRIRIELAEDIKKLVATEVQAAQREGLQTIIDDLEVSHFEKTVLYKVLVKRLAQLSTIAGEEDKQANIAYGQAIEEKEARDRRLKLGLPSSVQAGEGSKEGRRKK